MYSSCTAPAASDRLAHIVVAIIITYDRPALLRRCLEAVQAQQRSPELDHRGG